MNRSLSRRHLLAMAAAAAGTLTLTSLPGCGGGGDLASDDVKTVEDSSRQFVSGSIGALSFGGVALDELELSAQGRSSNVEWFAVQAVGAGDAGTPAVQLKSVPAWHAGIGMVAEGFLEDAPAAAKLLIRPVVVGAVEVVAPLEGRLVVAGHELDVPKLLGGPVRDDGPAMLGVADLWSLRVGDRLAIYGDVDPAGKIAARCVELLSWTSARLGMSTREEPVQTAANTLYVKGAETATGPVNAALPEGAQTFGSQLAGTTVVHEARALGRPQVQAMQPTHQNAELALAVLEMPIEGGQRLAVSGITRPLRGAPGRVSLRGLEVAQTVLGELQPGVRTQVTGKVAGRQIVPSKAVDLARSIPTQRLEGRVGQFMGAGSFVIRGHLVNAMQAGFTGGDIAHLGNGAAVSLTGAMRGQVFMARHVKFEDRLPAGVAMLSGPFTEVDLARQTLRMSGQTVAWDAQTRWATLSAFGLSAARHVRVKGRRDSYGILTAETVVAGFGLPTVVSGTVTEIAGSAIKVNGRNYILSSHTAMKGLQGDATPVEVSRGMRVAMMVQTRPEVLTDEVGVNSDSGFVSWMLAWADDHRTSAWSSVAHDVASVSQWRLDGQLMDASKADVVRGDIGDLAEGARVLVQGELQMRGQASVYSVSRLWIFEDWMV